MSPPVKTLPVTQHSSLFQRSSSYSRGGGRRQEFKTAQTSTRIMSPDSAFWGFFILFFCCCCCCCYGHLFCFIVCVCVCVCVGMCILYCVFLCEWGYFYFIWMKGGGNKIKLHVYSQILIFKKGEKARIKSNQVAFSQFADSPHSHKGRLPYCQHFTVEWYICYDQWMHTHCNHTNFIVYTKLHSVQWVSEERTRNKRNKCQLNKKSLLSRLFLLS